MDFPLPAIALSFLLMDFLVAIKAQSLGTLEKSDGEKEKVVGIMEKIVGNKE